MPRSDKECKKIGIQMAHGLIFHSQFLPEMDDKEKSALLCKIFLPLMGLTEEQMCEYEKRMYIALFEYYGRAMSRGINGYPMFTSVQGLTREDNSRVIAAYLEERTRMKDLEDDKEAEEEAACSFGPRCPADGTGGGAPVSEP